MSKIRPVILSGGAGMRLWPLSRSAQPKQFLELAGEKSLFGQTCQRFAGSAVFDDPLVISSDECRFLVLDELESLGLEASRIVLEPFGRNTAPAALAAALLAIDQDEPDQLLLLAPSDHYVSDEKAFAETIAQGVQAARDGHIVVYGVTPDAPAEDYGYIKTRAAGSKAVLEVEGFTEKPDAATAAVYLEQGGYFWNAGIFLVSARRLAELFDAHAPQLMEPCIQAVSKAEMDLNFLRLDAEAWEKCENISIDYAILENTSRIRCVPLQCGWSDLGSFGSIWNLRDKDDRGNAASGDVLLQDARGCMVESTEDAPLVTLSDVSDLAVIATPDAVMITPRNSTEGVRKIVSALKAENREELNRHKRVYRPWGWYESLNSGERYQIKRLLIHPGARLSLQRHYHRSEHWVVVTGTARVTRDGTEHLLTENDSIYLPVGADHRIENPGKMPLIIIEVQTGAYLGEDDIERLADDYGRKP